VRVVEYLEGVEHQYYCQPALVPTAEPRWRPVVDAERNLTKLLRDNYLTLVVIRNVSLAYFARVGPYLTAAEATNSSLAKAAAASVKEYLALLNKTPAAVPLYYTAPDSYRGEERPHRMRHVRLETRRKPNRRAPPPPREGVVVRLIPNGAFEGG
jgi:hypothetical protein